MGHATVSVIITTYNRALMLGLAADSVAAQTYRPLQLIVVDDGSTDDMEKVLSSIKHKSALYDLDLTVIRQKNQGVSAARNAGIRSATGEFILFLDSDDFLSFRACELLVSEIGDKDVCVGGWMSVGGCAYGRETFIPDVPGSEDPLEDYILEKMPCLHGMLARTECVRRSPLFPEHLSFGEDLIYCYSLLHNSHGVARVPEPVYMFVQHDIGRLSHEMLIKRSRIARLGAVEYFSAVGKYLLDPSKGTLDVRKEVSSKLIVLAIQVWQFNKTLSQELHSLAKQIDPDARPHLRKAVSRAMWSLGGLALCGMAGKALELIRSVKKL